MGVPKIVVSGAGPAGAAVAIGLGRLGEDVIVVAEPRRFAAVEGVSARTLDGLRGAGFAAALETFASPSQRWVTWNGETTAANTEQLVERRRFDNALLDDLEQQGVAVWRGRALECAGGDGGYALEVERGGARHSLKADFLVEARGRAAPGQGLPRVRGVETVSLLQYWQGPAGRAQSAVHSFADGWAWMAALGDGRRYLQLTLDVETSALPPRKALAEFCRARFETLVAARPYLHDAVPIGEPCARASTPVLNEAVSGSNWIRVGDAAMAVDPLSGNGIFQALSSALQAPAVIRTLLHDGSNAALAARFHRQRIETLFYRFARIGRDFHAQESQWPDQPFWRVRRAWPDARPLHLPSTPDTVRVERMPVVEAGRIVEDEVVVTPDQPNGVWHLNGVKLAPLLRAVHEGGVGADAEDLLCARLDGRRALAAGIAAWMREQGWID